LWALNFITGVFTGNWQKAWEGVKKIFKGVFDSLWGIVKVPLNLIIDGINAVIGALNSIRIKIPDWVPGLGGKSFGIHIPKIPKLAEGGIVNRPTLAMIGEAGPEAVIPLSGRSDFTASLQEAVERGSYMGILQGIRIASASGTGTQEQEIVLKIDSTTFARLILPAIIREGQRQGLNLVVTQGA